MPRLFRSVAIFGAGRAGGEGWGMGERDWPRVDDCGKRVGNGIRRVFRLRWRTSAQPCLCRQGSVARRCGVAS